jgi:DNA-binding transcriptional MerR regulator
MKAYTTGQLAKLAGVSVRTLHHYDHLGLLGPSARTAAGYRLYGGPELLRLQQILFFKELDLPLEEIDRILDDPGFDPVESLRHHRQLLQREMERLAHLLNTIDKTIHRLTEDDMQMTDDELYAGFTPEQAERYRREARETYGPAVVEEAERRAKRMSQAEWQAHGEEGEAVTRGVAGLMDRAPDDPEVQALIARHHAWIEGFYPASAERYRGLSQLYVIHPEFQAFYDKYSPGLADFMAEAMAHYADTVLAERSE